MLTSKAQLEQSRSKVGSEEEEQTDYSSSFLLRTESREENECNMMTNKAEWGASFGPRQVRRRKNKLIIPPPPPNRVE
jgi:hypothetical protein